ncbi:MULTISPECIES: STAS/SEC14 domain-containing protein [Polyangium]|uniref:STAS/SEC14 domain-containing protein n=2 Tax=Polyangium TaxID=55 RepID=A0A4U1ICW9_9BACT|nr:MULTISPECIES: STAS/SEC14 domain-containing protein [Polyangium]MDI1433641.1 STAS/SEC14 domain-containing protein [Polyangium sorediatum]TKC91461.1 hypothetical protein E8A74_50665 [Polyangium fumosum]
MTDDERGCTLVFGPHHARLYPPDVVRVFWSGTMTAEDIETLYTWTDEILPARVRHFVIADMSRLQTMTAAARKSAATDPRAQRVAGFAVLGANFHMRVLMGMFVKALGLFYRGWTFRMEFFERDADALAWFDAERAERAPTSE